MEQQPRPELVASMDDMLRIIGQQAVEIAVLRAEIARLGQAAGRAGAAPAAPRAPP